MSVSFEELQYRPPDLIPEISFLLSFPLHNEASLIEFAISWCPKGEQSQLRYHLCSRSLLH